MSDSGSGGSRAKTALARMLLTLGEGERLATTIDLQREIDVGSGTIQNSLRSLVQDGAITLRARGHLGTFLETKNCGLLWNFAALPAPHIALPPVGSRETLGIALALTEQITYQITLPTFGYYRGAAARLERLVHGADLTVMSSGAANHLLPKNHGYETMQLDKHTYYAPGSLIVISRPGLKNLARPRVAIDSSSDDHVALSRIQFSTNASYIEADFRRVPALVLENVIDAGVWHRTELLITPEHAGLAPSSLSPKCEATATERSAAVIVAKTKTPGSAILRALDLPKLHNQYHRVQSTADVTELIGPGFGATRAIALE